MENEVLVPEKVDMYELGKGTSMFKQVSFSEEMPPEGEILTSIGWLTHKDGIFHYRGVSRHKVNITSESNHIWWMKPV